MNTTRTEAPELLEIVIEEVSITDAGSKYTGFDYISIMRSNKKTHIHFIPKVNREQR